MWECPDLFALDGTHVLICCPQGLAREPHRYLNTYPATWMSGAFDYERARSITASCTSWTRALSFTPRKRRWRKMDDAF
jgi:sucrose-6-phosphate hydrolase SacC (GH32 family)